MPTLRSPNGRTYRTEDEAEVRNLTLGHGYTVVPEDQPAAPDQPATEEHDEHQDDDEYEDDQ
ncbi:hypothetical protein [Saccharopolyspora phatthalungensis]|uniref:Uncharacterized protein n=1 Tax=Saccharopolyspora phatthalungensis TaxID=664693 RepID=A0A840Q937_9PSEU|nr:hypothetical protein [Saccharopolyspora phatthalungensis]MBB5154955.1 hypothetical protein [Saccharopolyspora phatthalungensis]